MAATTNEHGIPVTSAPAAFSGGGTLNATTACHKLMDHLARNGGVWELPPPPPPPPASAAAAPSDFGGTSDWVHPRADHHRGDHRYPPGTRYRFRLLFARQSPGFAATNYSWWPADDANERHRQSHVGKFECTERGIAMWQPNPHERFVGPVVAIDGSREGRVRAVMTGITSTLRRQKVVLEVPTVAESRSRLYYYSARDDGAVLPRDMTTKRRRFASGPNSKLAATFQPTEAGLGCRKTSAVGPTGHASPAAGIQFSQEFQAAHDEQRTRDAGMPDPAPSGLTLRGHLRYMDEIAPKKKGGTPQPTPPAAVTSATTPSWGSPAEPEKVEPPPPPPPPQPDPFRPGQVCPVDFEAPLDVREEACMLLIPKIAPGMKL